MKTSDVPDTRNAMRAIHIIREVCDKHGISPQELKGGRRTREFTTARIECAGRLRGQVGMNDCEIGRMMCRDHTTIRYYFKKRSHYSQANSGYFLVSGWNTPDNLLVALTQSKWSGVS